MIMKEKDGQKTDDEVNEATAKLKGMLGIGIGSPPTEESIPTVMKESTPIEGEQPCSEDPDTTVVASTGKKKKSNASKKKSKQQNELPPQPAKSEESKSGNKKKPGKKKKEKEAGNFAWSAFQSSPDASKLPIPAFSSNKGDDEKVFPEPVNDDNRSPPSMEMHATESLEKASTTLEAEEIQAILKTDQEREADEVDSPVSKTGVNLAAALAAASSSAPETPSEQSENAMRFHSPSPFGSVPNMHHPFPPHPMHLQHSPPPYPPPPPSGYITIQVQVPLGLMPDRQMVVTSPSGFPVQVVVPEGVRPGMVIPVHVPSGPPPPMHMMPPPPHGQYSLYNPHAHSR